MAFFLPIHCLVISVLSFLLAVQKGGPYNYALFSYFTLLICFEIKTSHFRMWFQYEPCINTPASTWSLEDLEKFK